MGLQLLRPCHGQCVEGNRKPHCFWKSCARRSQQLPARIRLRFAVAAGALPGRHQLRSARRFQIFIHQEVVPPPPPAQEEIAPDWRRYGPAQHEGHASLARALHRKQPRSRNTRRQRQVIIGSACVLCCARRPPSPRHANHRVGCVRCSLLLLPACQLGTRQAKKINTHTRAAAAWQRSFGARKRVSE